MKIALLCPTRNRMNKLLTLISSLLTTVSNPENVKLILGVDEDDPIKDYYDYLAKNTKLVEVVYFKNNGKFLGLSNMWNNMYQACNHRDIYAMVGDDMVFKTKNWDIEIINEFITGPKDNILMVHCNDGMRGIGNKHVNVKPFCVNFFVHKRYIETVGYFVEPYIENIHQDTWTQVVFDTLNRTRYRHDILIKHLHQSETKSVSDDITNNLEALRVGIWDNNDWMVKYKKELYGDIDKLRKVINT